jgi:hypothetical protein
MAHGASAPSGGTPSGSSYKWFVLAAFGLALIWGLVEGKKWWSSGSSGANEQPTTTIAGETLLLSRRPGGGIETEPFFVGTRKVSIPIGNQQCIHIGQNGAKVELVGTDGAYNDSFEAYYKSKGKKPVKITVIYYPYSSSFCAHLHETKRAESDEED